MKKEDLQGKTVDELEKTLLDLKKEQFNLRIQKSQGQLENTARIRAVRRAVARVKTLIGQQQAGGKAVPAAAEKKASAKPAKKAAAPKTKKSGEKAA